MRPLAAPQAPPRCSGLRGACPVATSPRGCRSQAELLSLPCRRPPPPWTVQAAQEEPNPNPNPNPNLTPHPHPNPPPHQVNWSPSLGTAVSDLEVDYVDEEGARHLLQEPYPQP